MSEINDFIQGKVHLDFWERSGTALSQKEWSETENTYEVTTNLKTKESWTRVVDSDTSNTTKVFLKDSNGQNFNVQIPENCLTINNGDNITFVGIKKAGEDLGHYVIVKNNTTKYWFQVLSARELNLKMKFDKPDLIQYLIALGLLLLGIFVNPIGYVLLILSIIGFMITMSINYKKLDKYLFETGFFLDIEKNDERIALMKTAFAKSKPSFLSRVGFVLSVLAKLLSGHNDMSSTVKKYKVSQNKAFKSIA